LPKNCHPHCHPTVRERPLSQRRWHHAACQDPCRSPTSITLLGRRPAKVVAVALANKMARIAWAVMLRRREYQPKVVAP
jgi:hypothetical protein